MNAPDIETRLSQTFGEPTRGLTEIDTGVVLAAGRRRRRHLRVRQVVVASTAVLVLAIGVAVATAPPTGTPLSPVASWLRGEHSTRTWLQANSQRFVVTVHSVADSELDFSIDHLNSDGNTSNLMGVPTSAEQLPAVGMTTSQFPGVVFGIFPAVSRDIAAHTPQDRYHYEVSTMTVTDPATGQDYVAAAISATYDATSQIHGYTWTDAHGTSRSFGF